MNGYRGWIAADESERERLEGLGVTLGPYVGDAFENCHLSLATLEKLDQFWGIYVWGLEPYYGDDSADPSNHPSPMEKGDGRD